MAVTVVDATTTTLNEDIENKRNKWNKDESSFNQSEKYELR